MREPTLPRKPVRPRPPSATTHRRHTPKRVAWSRPHMDCGRAVRHERSHRFRRPVSKRMPRISEHESRQSLASLSPLAHHQPLESHNSSQLAPKRVPWSRPHMDCGRAVRHSLSSVALAKGETKPPLSLAGQQTHAPDFRTQEPVILRQPLTSRPPPAIRKRQLFVIAPLQCSLGRLLALGDLPPASLPFRKQSANTDNSASVLAHSFIAPAPQVPASPSQTATIFHHSTPIRRRPWARVPLSAQLNLPPHRPASHQLQRSCVI